MPRVTQKGQVTIPIDVRKMLDIKTGDELLFEIRDGEVIVRKRQPAREAFHKFVGFLSHLQGKESDEIIEELRGKPDALGH